MNIESKQPLEIFIKGNSNLIIMVHGFMGSPYNFHFMMHYFKQKGYSIWIPLLLEHNNVENINNTLPFEWYEDLKIRIIEHLNQNIYQNIHLIGLSMGGSFCLKMSVELNFPNIKTLSLLATPYQLKFFQKISLHLFGYSILKTIYPYKKRKESDIKNEIQKAINAKQKKVSIRVIFGLSYFLKEVKNAVKKVITPIFIAHSKKDNTIPFKQCNFFYKKVNSYYKELLILKKSYHILPLDVERDYLFENLYEFIKQFEV